MMNILPMSPLCVLINVSELNQQKNVCHKNLDNSLVFARMIGEELFTVNFKIVNECNKCRGLGEKK